MRFEKKSGVSEDLMLVPSSRCSSINILHTTIVKEMRTPESDEREAYVRRALATPILALVT
jgi:hypothetical protein